MLGAKVFSYFFDQTKNNGAHSWTREDPHCTQRFEYKQQ